MNPSFQQLSIVNQNCDNADDDDGDFISMFRPCFAAYTKSQYTRDVFYVRRKVDLMKTAKVNAYIMHIFGKIEILSIHAT